MARKKTGIAREKVEESGQAFLKALEKYIDFRLNPPKARKSQGRKSKARRKAWARNSVPASRMRFVPLFEKYLKALGGDPDTPAFKRLVVNMSKMQTVRGGGALKPVTGDPNP